jgi:hypothetical protein
LESGVISIGYGLFLCDLRDVDWLRMTGPSAERPSDRKIKQRLRQTDLRKYIIEAAKADCSIEGALESKDFRLT